MTQEDKDLLLQDLCGRLPYGIKVQYFAGGNDKTYICNVDQVSIKSQCVGIAEIEHTVFTWRTIDRRLNPENIKEKNIIGKGVEIRDVFINIVDSTIKSLSYAEIQAVFDWFNAHHFDYRGLIEKGLALEAPEGMYYSV